MGPTRTGWGHQKFAYRLTQKPCKTIFTARPEYSYLGKKLCNRPWRPIGL
jgi:hypothetical protein